MKLIIPMAGRGKRLRPQSNVTPKPLLSIAGKTVVERILEGFKGVLPCPVTEAVFVLGPSFGPEVSQLLETICEQQQIRVHTLVQHEPLGTAHAVAVAKEFLHGEGIIVYADTIFVMNEQVTVDGADVVAWVKEVDDPSRFGVVVRDGDQITAFVEKPKESVSREALIGIYYIRALEELRLAIDKLLEENITGPGGEYFLTDALDILLKKKQVFKIAAVDEWLDCGTLQALFETACRLLELEGSSVPESGNSIYIEPVFVGPDVRIDNSVIGPNVCIENGATVERSVVRNSILFKGARVCCTSLSNSFVGAHAAVCCQTGRVNIGDYSVLT